MKTALAYIWQRRWCKVGLAIGLLFGLLNVHPLVRQMLFGPKIDGVPWCLWEDEFRRHAEPSRRRSWIQAYATKIGLISDEQLTLPIDGPAGYPVCLHLVNDEDVHVRRFVLHGFAKRLITQPQFRDEILPILRQHLDDDDPQCRLTAARGVWHATKDPKMKELAFSFVNGVQEGLRNAAANLLYAMAVDDAELFGPMCKLAEDPQPNVRGWAIRSMGHFGKQGLAQVAKGLRDPDWQVRAQAVQACFLLEGDAREFVPALLTLQNDNAVTRVSNVGMTLHRVDPARFPAK